MIVDKRKLEKEKYQIERKRKKKFMTKIRGFFHILGVYLYLVVSVVFSI